MKLNRGQIRQIIYESLSEQNMSNPNAVKSGDVIGDTSVEVKIGDQKFKVTIALLQNQDDSESGKAFAVDFVEASSNKMVAEGMIPLKGK